METTFFKGPPDHTSWKWTFFLFFLSCISFSHTFLNRRDLCLCLILPTETLFSLRTGDYVMCIFLSPTHLALFLYIVDNKKYMKEVHKWINERCGLGLFKRVSMGRENQEKKSPELPNLAPKHGLITSLQTIITSSVSVLHFSCQIFYFFNFALCILFSLLYHLDFLFLITL